MNIPGFGSRRNPAMGTGGLGDLTGHAIADLGPRLNPATGKPLDVRLRGDGPPHFDPFIRTVLRAEAEEARAAASLRGKADRLLVGIEFDGAKHLDLLGESRISAELLDEGDLQAWAILGVGRQAGADVISIRAKSGDDVPVAQADRVDIVFLDVFERVASITGEALWSSHDHRRRRRRLASLGARWDLKRIVAFIPWQACVTLGMADPIVSTLDSQVSVPVIALVAPAVALSLVVGWFGGIKLLHFRDWAMCRWHGWREERRKDKARAFMQALVAVSGEFRPPGAPPPPRRRPGMPNRGEQGGDES